MRIPTKLIDANVYLDGNTDWIGKGAVTLPEITQKTQDYDSFGIAGTIEVPLIGQIEKLEGSMKLHSITNEGAVKFLNPAVSSQIVVRGAFSYYDTSTGAAAISSVKVTMQAFFKKTGFPEMKKAGDGEYEFGYAAHYLKIELDDVEVLEIDQLQYIYKVAGVDVLADHKAALGIS